MHKSLAKSRSASLCSAASLTCLIVLVACQLGQLVDACSIDLATCSHLFEKNSRHHHASSAHEHLFDHELAFESRVCFCDKHCKTYRDCCRDFEHVAPESFRTWKEPQLENIQHADLLFDCNLYIHDDKNVQPSSASFVVNGAFSVNKCTVPETSDELRSIADKCVNDVVPIDTNFADLSELNGKLKEHDPLLLLPVSIKQQRDSQPLTYRNIYCALCNNISLSEWDMKKMEFWQLGASCASESAVARQPERASNSETEGGESEHATWTPASPIKDRNCIITYKRNSHKSMKSMGHNGVRKCKLSKSRCVEDTNARRLGEPSFAFNLDELDSISKQCHSFQSFRYQDDLRYRNKYCGMCNNIGAANMICEPKNLVADVQQLLAKAPKHIDLSYENNRLLYNQSAYRAVIEAKYEVDKRTITFINHLDEQQQQHASSSNEPNSSEQSGQAAGRSVKDLVSYEHVLYWKSLPASQSSITSADIRSLAICLSTVVLSYLFF